MLINRSHLQYKIQILERHSFDTKNQNRFSEFFTKCRAIFSPEVTGELNIAIKMYQSKHKCDLKTAEYYIWLSRNVLRGQGSLYKDVVTEEFGYQIMTQERVNWIALENDLDYLVSWCHKKVNKISWASEIDFSQQIEIKKGANVDL